MFFKSSVFRCLSLALLSLTTVTIFPSLVRAQSYTKIADTTTSTPAGGTFNSLGGFPSLSGSNVVFGGGYTGGTGTTGLFANLGAGLTAIATNGSAQVPGGGTFSSFSSSPVVSGSNVAFQSAYTGGTGSSGIFAKLGGVLTKIATNSGAQVPGGGTFGTLGNASLSGSTAAFFGSYTGGTGTSGIFTGSGGSLTKVISDGDTLFGSTVTSVSFGKTGLDGSGVAFQYTLADGRSGIASTAIPEPGTLALLALGGALVLVKRRRK